MHGSKSFDENLIGKSGLPNWTISYVRAGVLSSHSRSEPHSG